jgi:mono/diheme cytochrome c family protein
MMPLIEESSVGIGNDRHATVARKAGSCRFRTTSNHRMSRLTHDSRAVAWIALVIAVAAFGGLCLADEVAFVSGVERFGRHDRIDQFETGRLLITELNCTKCHRSESEILASKGGPSLSGAGRRLNRSWVREYVANPGDLHPGTTMPDMLGDLTTQQGETVANDIAAFLATQQQSFPIIKASGATPVMFEFWNRGRLQEGRTLYHSIGCVACHEPDDDFEVTGSPRSAIDAMIDQLDQEELEELGLSDAARPVPSVSHANLAAKYTLQGLTFFLLDPDRYRPGGRMPNLKLTTGEAADLASYLIGRDQAVADSASDQAESGDAELGHLAFERFRCNACHQVGGPKLDFDVSELPKLNELRRDKSAGCLQAGHGRGPSYALDDFQRDAIVAALASSSLLAEASTSVKLQHRLLQLNCYACHVRDERGGVGRRRKDFFHSVGNIDLGDEGRLPPSLTGAGQKIKPAWFSRVLTGNKADIRPHMTIRMPKFHSDQVKELPRLFAEVDALHKLPHIVETDSNPPNNDLIEAGRQLMDIGCIQCHPFDGFAMPGVVGVELAGIADRVNRDWFMAFLHDPGSLKTRTRMPNFFNDGKTQNKELLGGDPDRQIAAMWAYLADVPKHSLPEKLLEARSQTYELVPHDRPILLRTFMDTAGTHAIAVGNPQGVHYAFDADQVGMATAWRGKFLDAQGTWFIRFAPPADPLGVEVIEFPTGNMFAEINRRADIDNSDFKTTAQPHRFDGYRLNAEGIPSFLYRMGGIAIEDQTVAAKDGSLTRTWKLKPEGNTPHRIAFSPLAGRSVKKLGDGRFVNEKGLQVQIKRLPASAATIVSDQDQAAVDPQRLVYLIDIPTAMTLQVNYSW